MIVIKKFGGTSLATKDARILAIEKIKKGIENNEKIIVVVSAIGRSPSNFATDSLIKVLEDNVLEEEYKNTISYKRNLDLMMSQGENISSIIMSIMLESVGIKAKPINAKDLGIITDDNFGDANIIKLKNKKIMDLVNQGYIPVVTGFQGINEKNEITTLGRGGSDFTAVVISKMVNADMVEIYTDVDGVMDFDPKVNKAAKKYKSLNYDSLIKLCDNGAKVVHIKAAKFGKIENINMRILNTFSNNTGTCINNELTDSF